MESELFARLENLVVSFRRDVSLAHGLQSSNTEDDLPVKVGIVGFSYTSPTSEWGPNHYEFLRRRLETD